MSSKRIAALTLALVLGPPALADTSLAPRAAEIMPKAAQSILNDVVAVEDGFLAVGDRGHILRSGDGRAWQQLASPVQAMLNRLRFFDGRRGWAVGHDATVLETRDGGRSWRLIHSDPAWGKPMYDILFLDEQHGFLVGANSVFKETRDGGVSWDLLEPDFTLHGLNLNAILALADGSLVIAGEKGLMVRSQDRGATWQQLQTPYAGSFFGMLPYRKRGVFVFGLRGNVYAALDVTAVAEQDPMDWDEFELETETDPGVLAARGWRHYPNALNESLFGGLSLGSEDVLLVGVNGAMVRSRKGRMQVIETEIEHTLANVLRTADGLLTVGFLGIQALPFAP